MQKPTKRQKTILEEEELFAINKYHIEDVFVTIFSFLDVQDIIQCSLVCKSWYQFTCNPLLKKIWAKKFGVVLKTVPQTFHETGTQIINELRNKVTQFKEQLKMKPLHFRTTEPLYKNKKQKEFYKWRIEDVNDFYISQKHPQISFKVTPVNMDKVFGHEEEYYLTMVKHIWDHEKFVEVFSIPPNYIPQGCEDYGWVKSKFVVDEMPCCTMQELEDLFTLGIRCLLKMGIKYEDIKADSK